MEITLVRKESTGRISKQVTFTLCGSCYWCASYLDGHGIEKCPLCYSNMVESLPVAGNEAYIFDHDSKRGVTVDFVPMKVPA